MAHSKLHTCFRRPMCAGLARYRIAGLASYLCFFIFIIYVLEFASPFEQLSRYDDESAYIHDRFSSSLQSSQSRSNGVHRNQVKDRFCNFCLDLTGASDSALERRALVDIFTSNNGQWWIPDNTQYWGNLSVSICSWDGVCCNNQCRIIHLSRSRINMTGSLPSSIGFLTELVTLDFSFNSIQGQLPSEITNSRTIESLSLNNNFFSGTLPSDFGNAFRKLKYFDCSVNLFSGPIPAGLAKLPALYFVSMHHNYFSGTLPSDFATAFSAIAVLDIQSNQLTGTIPASLFSPRYLSAIILSHNNFFGTLPLQLGSATQIKAVDFSFNSLIGEVDQLFANLTNLLYMDLSHNNFTGVLPDMRPAKQLISLMLSHNGFNRLPPSWVSSIIKETEQDCRNASTDLASLSLFDCSHCQLLDGVQTTLVLFSSLPALGQLKLSSAFSPQNPDTNLYWTEVFTQTFCRSSADEVLFSRSWFSALTLLDLSHNRILGNGALLSFPSKQAFFGNITSLLVISLADVPGLTGPIDDEWSTLLQIDVRGTSVDSLPSFVQQSFATPKVINKSVWCPQFVGINNQVMMIDEDFQQFRNCFCAPGYEGIAPNCVSCKPGFYRSAQPVNDSDPMCIPCENGYFAASSGLSTCTLASDGEFVDSDHTSSHPCPSSGAYCANGQLLGTNDTWVDGLNFSIAVDTSVSAYLLPCTKNRCIVPSAAALSASRQNFSSSSSSRAAIPSLAAWCSSNRYGSLDSPARSDVNQLVLEFYSNIGCGKCLPGFIEVSGECLQCDSYHYGYLVLGWIVSLLLVFFLRQISQNTNRGTVQIFSFYITIVRQLAPASLVSVIVSWMDLRVSDGTSARCIVPAASIEIEAWIMYALLMTWLNVGLAMLIEYCYRACTASLQDSRLIPNLQLAYVRTFMVVVTISISSAIDTAISVLQTVYVPSLRTHRILQYPDIDSASDAYAPFRALGISIWVLFACYLAIVFWMLRFGSNSTEHPLLAEAVHIWQDSYKPDYKFSEIYVIIRRVAFLLLSRFLLSNSSKMAAINTMLLMYLLVATQFKLYQHSDDVALETFLIVNVMCFTSYLQTNDFSNTVVPILSLVTALLAFLIALIRQHAICSRLNRIYDSCVRQSMPEHDRSVDFQDNTAHSLNGNNLLNDFPYHNHHNRLDQGDAYSKLADDDL